MEKVRIGMIGLGGVAHYGHLAGYLESTGYEITAVCDINEEHLHSMGDECGVPMDHRFTDYRDLIACEDVDAVDIATWNSVHCEIAKAAALAGKPFSVEKPVGMNYAESYDLQQTAAEKKVPSFVCLSWRYRPYTRYVKYLISGGKLGKLYHIYVRCIKESGLWPGRKREWRFDKSRAASGVLGDLGSHMIDIVRFWGQEFTSVYANSGIIIKERPSEETGEILPVDTDDWCNMIAELESGVSCTINLTRCATTVSDIIQFEVYGEKGRLVYTYEGGEQSILFVDNETKKSEWLTPPEEFNAIQSQSYINLVQGIEDEYTAKIEQGVACQAVIDAALRSTEEHRVVTIAEITGECK
ncbi:MAG: Gfo/Idh/MocA family oxidoreductase [Clostridia bacterium]|nr:Gfo/Idh/MocA family oxidoreductase [Clostridia bacterium]